jgi:hypothetical protein
MEVSDIYKRVVLLLNFKKDFVHRLGEMCIVCFGNRQIKKPFFLSVRYTMNSRVLNINQERFCNPDAVSSDTN